jgi:Protein of unknown function with PCYCGC motif
MVSKYRFRILSLTIILIALIATACSETGKNDEPVNTSPKVELPAEVRAAPLTVQQAYQFAVANPDVLGEVPCYCGCGAMGHTSNYACYVSGQDQDGKPLFDNHALGCSICVDITLDTMRLMEDGKSVDEIRSYVDQTYSQYGPSNIP